MSTDGTRGVDEIARHFDREGTTREAIFARDPVLGYEQAVRQATIDELMSGSFSRILDAGCGNGRDLSLLFARSERIVACDLSEVMIQGAKARLREIDGSDNQNVALTMASITELPYGDGTFDGVVCSEVLEHVPNWTAAISEFSRVLKPGGWLTVSTPNKLSMYGATRYAGRFLFGSRHAYDKWKSYWEHRSVLTEAGFRVQEVRGACYLAGDLSYYPPVRQLVALTSSILRPVDRWLGGSRAFRFLGYMIVLKAQKL